MVVFVFVSLILFALSYKSADAAVGVKIQPIKISTTIEKGGESVGTITLSNESDLLDNVIIETSVEDFVPLEGGSNINFVGRTEGLTTAADWITLDVPQTFELVQGETKKVQYRIQAPENAEPGSHFSVIFFKALKKDDEGQLKVGTRVGTLVFITVPGNYEQKGEILNFGVPASFFQKGPVPFEINFKNTGTVHFEPKGEIVVKNMFGRESAKIPVEGQVVLPTGARKLSAVWAPSGFIVGKYIATLSILDGAGNVLTAENVAFYAFPIWHALIFLVLLIVVYLLLRFIRRNINISISVNK